MRHGGREVFGPRFFVCVGGGSAAAGASPRPTGGSTSPVPEGRVFGRRCGMGVSQRQRRFIEEYLVDLNATQAAVRAGRDNPGRVIVALLPDTGERYLSTALFAKKD